MSDFAARWLFLAVCMLAQAALLLSLRIKVDLEAARQVTETVGLLLLFGTLLLVLSRRYGRPFAAIADACFSFAQFLVVLVVLTPFSYIAAKTNLPLLDQTFTNLDALLGFDWDALAAWVAERPVLDRTLHTVYFGLNIQTVLILLLGSLTRPGERNSEAIWLFIVSAIITVAVFAFTPALGKIGHLGTYQVEMLAQIREGRWSVLDYRKLGGIVNFPSFHTALAILWTYAARHHPLALAFSVPCNAVLIASTVPIGGHYLVDVFGGAAVAAVSVLIVRTLRKRIAASGRSAANSAAPQVTLATG